MTSFVNKSLTAPVRAKCKHQRDLSLHQTEITAQQRGIERRSMAISDCLKCFQDPIWTSREVEHFWAVLHPYLATLLDDEMPLPDTNIDFTVLDPLNEIHKKHCIKIIHDSLWKGKYSLAVANIKAVRSFFHDTVHTSNRNSTVAERLQELKEVFEQRPLER